MKTQITNTLAQNNSVFKLSVAQKVQNFRTRQRNDADFLFKLFKRYTTGTIPDYCYGPNYCFGYIAQDFPTAIEDFEFTKEELIESFFLFLEDDDLIDIKATEKFQVYLVMILWVYGEKIKTIEAEQPFLEFILQHNKFKLFLDDLDINKDEYLALAQEVTNNRLYFEKKFLRFD